ncbi:argininosuccinate synthase [mine drainage metagenome]|uniref:argininosuccinate synthase n=1 Tax=mine drainage metagenome TaxID=410659 RepID=T1A9P9_9ZZZZ
MLAFSGGLDTSFALVYLRATGYRVTAITVDTGGLDSEQRVRLADRARMLGAEDHRLVDARALLFDRYLRYLIYGNALKGGAYPLSVSAERTCQALAVAEVARELQADCIVDGSTGAGNDQVRFATAFAVLAPGLEHRSLIRELGWTRADEAAYLVRQGYDEWPSQTRYSVNQGLWGTTLGGGETHDAWASVPETVYPNGPIDPHRAPQVLTLGFHRGEPRHADSGDAVALIEHLNAIGAGYGIGRGIHLGETILGIKGRVVFEAPAASILITAHRELEKLVLSGAQIAWKETLGALYGALVHEARFFDPLARDLEAFLTSSQERVTGEVRIRLEPGRLVVEGVRSPHSLMDAASARYGETASLWEGRDARGFTKIHGLSQVLWARAARGSDEKD